MSHMVTALYVLQTCRTLVDTAFDACWKGIDRAQDQCLGVMDALGTVYHHAKVVLDRINPDRWSNNKQQLHQTSGATSSSAATGTSAAAARRILHRRRRATVIDDNRMIDELRISTSDRDICEPLDTRSVCQSLNDSGALCQPSKWAGEAIQEALNATRAAMTSLESTLHFYVSSDPYDRNRNTSGLIFRIRKQVGEDFASVAAYYHLFSDVVMKSVPAAIAILGCVAFVHLRNYLSKDDYDNIYVGDLFRRIDLERSKVSGVSSLLPLKRYERCYVVDAGSLALGRLETGLWSDGLCIFILHLLLTVVCYGFDFSLYWVLTLVQRHSRPGFDVTGSDSLDLVVTGRGIIVDLLDIFLKGFHPGRWFSFTGDTQACLPLPRPPSLPRLCVFGGLYGLLLLSIVLKAYVLRLRDRITGFFYDHRQLERVSHLWRVLATQRSQIPRLLHEIARVNHRNNCATLPICYGKSTKTGCGQDFCSRCLVCGSRVFHRSIRVCERTRGCPGRYCSECFDDLERICPLCAEETSEQLQPNKEGLAPDQNVIVHSDREEKLP